MNSVVVRSERITRIPGCSFPFESDRGSEDDLDEEKEITIPFQMSAGIGGGKQMLIISMKATLSHPFLRGITAVFFLSLVLSVFSTPEVFGQDAEELAKELANPIASLISFPFQLNFDSNIGQDDRGDRFLLNIQPVMPYEFNEDWNVVSRTILPVISQDDVFPGEGNQMGLGDIVQSVFFSPKRPTKTGWIWGAGPVMLFPTATDTLLGSKQWGLGPTAVVLRQSGPWTYGALANHIWSVAGDDKRPDINATFVQPFLSFTFETAVTVALNTESTYDWHSNQGAVPINVTTSRVMTLGNQLVSVGAGLRYWVKSTDNGPEGLAGRLILTLLFPK